LKVTNAVVELFTIRGMDTIVQKLGCPIPKRCLNLVIQDKFANKYTEKLITALEGSMPQDEAKLRQYQEGIDQIKKFSHELGQLSPDTEHAQSWPAWKAFVQKFLVSDKWEDALKNTEVLRNFGFDDDVSKGLMEENSVALNWLSKALTCYSLPGSMADVVNLAYAMTETNAPTGVVTEEQIVPVLTKFRTDLENGTAKWKPTVLIHDAELDDMACWLLLEHVSSKQGKKLSVYLQLPELEAGDAKAAALNAVASKYKPSCTQVYRDPDSSNTDAILTHSK